MASQLARPRAGHLRVAFHPEPSGLLRWGSTRTVDRLWWLPVSDSPQDWRIVASGDRDWAEFHVTTSEFVYRLLTRQPIVPVSGRTPRNLPGSDRSPQAASLFRQGSPWGDRWPQQQPSFQPTPRRPGSDWDPRPKGLLGQPGPVAGRVGWQAVIRERAAAEPTPAQADRAGHPVPADYLELVAEHGAGPYAGLAVAAVEQLPALGALVAARQRALRGGERFVPAHFHPEPGGLIPWGELPDGDLCWYPAGRDPATWPTVVCSPEGAGWQRYDLTTTAFLCDWLAGRVRLGYRTPPRVPLSERLDRLAELLGAGQANWVVDWAEVEADLGIGLPDDYRAFVERFGAGSVNEGLYVDTPSAAIPHFDLIPRHAQWADGLNPLHHEFPEYEPYPPYPPLGGLLLWGVTHTRVTLSWRTDGPDPNAWPVVLYNDSEWVDCGRGFLDVLLDHLTGRATLDMSWMNSFNSGSRRSLPSLERAWRTAARRWAWNGW